MLGFFTDPYPDELLYSACARYNDRIKYPGVATAVEELFGNQSATTIVDFPSRIHFLVAQLPPGHGHTANHFIDNHTLLPLYTPFISPERLQRCKEDMCGYKGNRVRERLGIKAGGIRPLQRLRFCPRCVQVDREKYGEAYWHRIHQITGVDLCPHHEVLLEASYAWRNDRRCPGRFLSADKAVFDATPRPLNLTNASHSKLLRVASHAAWLLQQRNVNLAQDALRDRYYDLLLNRGYAYYNGRVKAGKLLKDFVGFYSAALLDRLQCGIESEAGSWVTRLVLRDRASVVRHPLRHLLLITFLGCTMDEIFDSVEPFRPFGDKPWPCLNRASEHFGQLIIDTCRVSDCRVKMKRGKPAGTFSCKCGFVYNRIGPDSTERDRYRVNSVESYGQVWESGLREIWADLSVSLRESACRLGVSELTVVRHAIRLGLPINEPGSRQVGSKTLRRYKEGKSCFHSASGV